MRPNNVFYVPAAKDEALSFFVAAGVGLATKPRDAGRILLFYVRHDCSRDYIVSAFSQCGHPFLHVVCECKLPLSSARLQ